MTVDKVLFADTVQHFLGARYELGAWGPDAYDCASFIHCFYAALGLPLESTFDGHSPENYVGLFREDPLAAKRAMRAFLSSIGPVVDSRFLHRADLLVLSGARGPAAVVYLGGGHVMGIHAPVGVLVIALSHIESATREVRRPCPR